MTMYTSKDGQLSEHFTRQMEAIVDTCFSFDRMWEF